MPINAIVTAVQILENLYTSILGKCHFLPEGALENWGNQVLCLRSKEGIKRFFQIKRGDHLYFLKK